MFKRLLQLLTVSVPMAAQAQLPLQSSKVSYEDFSRLVSEVEIHRSKRLLSLDQFLEMARKNNVVLLDARSEFRYNRKHLKGAVNLNFSDFTQGNLQKIIPSFDTPILIYCNNNFEGDEIDFASKMAGPIDNQLRQFAQKPIMLALNIPTYINLYGYGYRNIYELGELVNVNDPRLVFEGSVVEEK